MSGGGTGLDWIIRRGRGLKGQKRKHDLEAGNESKIMTIN